MKALIILPAFTRGGFEASLIRLYEYLEDYGLDPEVVETSSFQPRQECSFPKSVIGVASDPYVWRICKLYNYLSNLSNCLIFNFSDDVLQGCLPKACSNKNVIVQVLRNDHPSVYKSTITLPAFWDFVITNSPVIYSNLQKKVPTKDIRFIPNGYSIPGHRGHRECPRTDANIVNILFVGRLVNESKGIFLIPLILRYLQSKGLKVHLTIVGDGPDKKSLVDQISQSELCGFVTFVEWQSPLSLSRLFYRADYLLLLSYYEGLPNVVIEALAHGCIPIMKRLNCLTSYLSDNSNSGLEFNIDNLQPLSDYIQNLETNIHLKAETKARCISYYHQNFSRSIEKARYNNLVKSCVSRGPKTPRYNLLVCEFLGIKLPVIAYLFVISRQLSVFPLYLKTFALAVYRSARGIA